MMIALGLTIPLQSAPPPDPGGGNPLPATSSVSPSSSTAGAGAQAITVSGSGFVSSSVIYVDGVPLTTTFGSAVTLTATIPSGITDVPGAKSVVVVSPGPGGGSSNSQAFTANYPTPTAASLSVSSVNDGAGATVTRVTGTGIYAATTALVDGSATGVTVAYVDATHIDVTVPAGVCSSPGNHTIALFNPSPGGGTSATLAFTVNYLSPTITSLTPSSGNIGDGNTSVAVVGTNFYSATVFKLDGTPITSSFTDATHATITVPSSALASYGTKVVTAVNPTPGGGTSGGSNFVVNRLTPTLSSI